jgi:TatA/E family protein of Tat protein translocase
MTVHYRDDAKEHHMLGEIFGVDGVIVLIVVVVLLFGGAAIPKLARNLGSAKNEFEKGLDDGKKSSAHPTTDTTTAGPPIVSATPATPVAEHVTPGT